MKKKNTTLLLCFLLLAGLSFSLRTEAQNVCSCWQPRDTSYHPVPFTIGVPPWYRNDDGSTNPIVLPFHFCFWGREMDTIYINNNGNLSFGASYFQYSPDTFPTQDIQMIAPFWADVDLNPASYNMSWDVVYYQITPTHMVVQWDSVGIYEGNTDADTNELNSFQVIISNGNDPIIPKGNNVEFCYKEMQWTTGSASQGYPDGFGGDPATVGANQGDGQRFIQIGLFDTSGTRYVGQFPPAPKYDGVGWLVNKSFLFNLCEGSVGPLTSGVSPCDTFKICLGDSMLIPFYYFSPIQGDSVWSDLAPPVLYGTSIIFNRPGATDSLVIKVVGSIHNLGSHVINVYGYDNAHPEDTTYTSFVVEIDTAPRVTVHASKDTICSGDTVILIAGGGRYYAWSNGATTSSIRVTPPSTHIYTVGISDGGCYKDTSLKVSVLPGVDAKFTTPTGCTNSPVIFPDSSTGGTMYSWNFGDPLSAPHDTSSALEGMHSYSSVGTYTVVLIVKNASRCSDTLKQKITVGQTPKPMITGLDSICVGYPDTLRVTGGGTYLWSNNSTANYIIEAPATQTFTVTATNGACQHDTTFTVKVDPFPAPKITASQDSVCANDSLTLTASGGESYLWSPGNSTRTTIHVSPSVATRYTLFVYGPTCVDTTSQAIGIIKRITSTVTLNKDSICQGTSTSLSITTSGSAALSYLWNTGATGDTITVSPDSTTSYYVLAQGKCNTDSVPQKVIVVPLPVPVISPLDSVCKGTIDTLTISGGTLYLWSNGSTKTYYVIRNIEGDSSISVKAYNYKDKRCFVYDTVHIPEKLLPSATTTKNAFVCAGSCTTLKAIPSGGGNYTFSWSSGSQTDSAYVCPSSDSIFYVVVSNGCKSPRASSEVKVFSVALSVCCDTTLQEYALSNSLVGSSETYHGDTAILTANSAKSYSWTPSSGLNCDTCRTVIATPTVTTTYTVTGIDSNGCEDVTQVTVRVEFPCFDFNVPNVFTPNGDNINDFFLVKTENTDSYTITIYDRWGKQVYTSNNPAQPWDGNTEGGSKALDGVYYYVITATCQGTNSRKNGFVQLIR